MNLTKRAVAELIGTFWLVLGGCGSAVLAAGIPELGRCIGVWLNRGYHGICNWPYFWLSS